jgi:hypothetical protein
MRSASVALALLMVMGAWTASFATAQDTSSQNPPAASNAKATPAAPSATDIAAAKASHKVWVNLDTGIYHKGGRWFGKTKNGKFMTVDDAKKAGYKAAKRD